MSQRSTARRWRRAAALDSILLLHVYERILLLLTFYLHPCYSVVMAEPEVAAAKPVAAAAPAEHGPLSSSTRPVPAQQAMPVVTPTTPTAAQARPMGTSARATPATPGVQRRRPWQRRGLPSSAYLALAAANLGMALLLLAAPRLVSKAR